MTVASEVNRSGPYIGNGVTRTFNYGFRILDKDHIKVIRAQAGVETVLVIDADYTVTGVGDASGGSIAMVNAPTSAQTITNLLNVPFTQEIDLENQGPYFAETIESALDLSVMRDQQMAEVLSRAVLIPASSADGGGALSAELAKNILRLGDSADNIDVLVDHVDSIDILAPVADDIGSLGPVAAAIGVLAPIVGDIATVADIRDDVVAAPANAASAIAARDRAEDARAGAEDARDQAAGLVSDAVSQGEVPIYATTMGLALLNLPAGLNALRVNGYTAAGDGGEALYKRVVSEPSHAGKRQSLDGAWWENAEPVLYAEQFGAIGDNVANDSVAWTNALTVGRTVEGIRGKEYRVADLVNNGGRVVANGARFRPAAGAKWLWRLTGFAPLLTDFLIDDFEEILVKSTTLSAGVLAGATTFQVASAANLEKGMLATVLMDNGRWHVSPITNIVGTTVTPARAFETTCTSGVAVDCSWGAINIRNAQHFEVSDFMGLNTSFGIVNDCDVLGGHSPNVRGVVQDGRLYNAKHVACFVGRDCADSRYLNCYLRGGKTEVWSYNGDGATAAFTMPVAAWLKRDVVVRVGGVVKTVGTDYTHTSTTAVTFVPSAIPSAGSNNITIQNFYDGKAGYVSDATGWQVIRGGDFIDVIECLDFLRGVAFHAKELTSIDQIISDTCSGEAIVIDNLCDKLSFGDAFFGYSHQPIKVKGNSANIDLDGPLWTTIPSASDTIPAPSSNAVDVETGSVIDINAAGWRRSANKTTTGGGIINYVGAFELRLGSQTAAPAGTTRYFGSDGSTNNNDTNGVIAGRDVTLKRLFVQTTAAPGAGQTFTYSVRVNGADVLTATISGAGVFETEALGAVTVTRKQRVDVKLVTSAGAASTAHRILVVCV
jgi:hypothetical protein